MTKHKWHKEIVAWADGAEIEFSYFKENVKEVWSDTNTPSWSTDDNFKYRIKPQPAQDLDIMSLINKHRGERAFFDGELLGAFFTVGNLEGLVKEAIEQTLKEKNND